MLGTAAGAPLTFLMPKTHIVQQGEHLSGIADENGFANYHAIWDHPSNQALRAVRDPHALFPGDELFIPDLRLKREQVVTTRVHYFKVLVTPLFLRLRLRDLDNQPIADTECQLGLESKKAEPRKTDAKGVVLPDSQRIKPSTRDGELVALVQKKPAQKDAPPSPVEKIKFDLKIGHLDPERRLSGQQARLNNLGYFAGFSLKDLDQLLWAVEEFQCEQMLNGQAVTQKPEIIPEPANPKAVDESIGTGVKDPAIRNKLKEVHGC